MTQPTDPAPQAQPGKLLAALEAAQATADSQVRRLLMSMLRVRDADASVTEAQAKDELGDAAITLHRIHSLLFGADGARPELPPLPALAPALPGTLANEDIAAALGEFEALRQTMAQATAEVERLLDEVEQRLERFDSQWKAAA
jgi:multidrug resistance efflux pump